jgi:hypothetical protein
LIVSTKCALSLSCAAAAACLMSPINRSPPYLMC